MLTKTYRMTINEKYYADTNLMSKDMNKEVKKKYDDKKYIKVREIDFTHMVDIQNKKIYTNVQFVNLDSRQFDGNEEYRKKVEKDIVNLLEKNKEKKDSLFSETDNMDEKNFKDTYNFKDEIYQETPLMCKFTPYEYIRTKYIIFYDIMKNELVYYDPNENKIVNDEIKLEFSMRVQPIYLCNKNKNKFIILTPELHSVVKSSYNSKLKVKLENTCKYTTVFLDTTKDGLGIELYDSDNTQLKMTKKNLYKLLENNHDDIGYKSGFEDNKLLKFSNGNKHYRVLKTWLWDQYKNYSAQDTTCYEILSKINLGYIYDVKDRIITFNAKGTNPKDILNLPKSMIKILQNNKISTYGSNDSQVNNMDLFYLYRLYNKYGTAATTIIKYAKELCERASKLDISFPTKIERYSYYNSTNDIYNLVEPKNYYCIFTFNRVEKLYDNKYLKNVDKLLEYLIIDLPEKQGYDSIQEGLCDLIEYINIVIELGNKKYVKYPDNLAKEIKLLKRYRTIITEKNKMLSRKYIKNLKDEILKDKIGQYKIVPLTTQDLLSNESNRMNNCVRGYGHTLDRLNRACVSIRLNNQSICTLELLNNDACSFLPFDNKNKINYDNLNALIKQGKFSNVQFKAKNNSTPNNEMNKIAQTYINQLNSRISNLDKEQLIKILEK